MGKFLSGSKHSQKQTTWSLKRVEQNRHITLDRLQMSSRKRNREILGTQGPDQCSICAHLAISDRKDMPYTPRRPLLAKLPDNPFYDLLYLQRLVASFNKVMLWRLQSCNTSLSVY